jgi:hypothetical protein
MTKFSLTALVSAPLLSALLIGGCAARNHMAAADAAVDELYEIHGIERPAHDTPPPKRSIHPLIDVAKGRYPFYMSGKEER